MKELHNILAQISQLNQQSAQLFAQRMQLVEQMALYKQAHGLEVWEELSSNQALAQSRPFLNSLGLETVECANTALAARQVGQSGDVTLAAIASAETAALYGLSVLARGINTDSTNTTRFIVISKQRPSQGNRFSLLFTARHQAGSLAQALQTIGEAGFNMECIKSRPRPGQPFAYYFYVELEGQAQQPQTGELLARLREICSTIRLLGVYTI